jgi:hypothetical protein
MTGRPGEVFRLRRVYLVALAAVGLLVPAPAFGEGGGEAAGTGAAAPTATERLKGAAGVGASTATDEALKGTGVGGAVKKGGSAAVQDYLKGSQGAPAGSAPGGDAAPAE